MSNIHLVSWNVNGIRAIIKKDFLKDIKELAPDILCLQEIKAQPEDAKIALSVMSDYYVYTNSSKARKGYSGTAIISKQKPLSISYDMGIEEHDQEGRIITAEYDNYFLVTVYTPNSGEGLKRLEYRTSWDIAFKNYLLNLEKSKPVVICGDLNVAHQPIDIARPKENYNVSSGYTQKEIDGLQNLLDAGYLDTFRKSFPDEVKYSWWNYRFQARQRNVGWRIDYFLISSKLETNLTNALIYNDRFGSDHCPVAIKINI
jgi:exodeoxyribonuclease III